MKDSKLDRVVAVKSFTSADREENVCQDAVREIVATTELCPCSALVDVLDVHFQFGKVYAMPMLVMTQMQGHLKVRPKTPHTNVNDIMAQIASGIEHMHAHGYMHRDLKPGNILVDSDKDGSNVTRVCIADFGLAKPRGKEGRLHTIPTQTLWYRCPQILLGNDRYGYEIDVWSLAIIHLDLLHKRSCVPADCGWDALMKISMMIGTPDCQTYPSLSRMPGYNTEWPKLKKETRTLTWPSIVERCLTWNPDARPSASEYVASLRATREGSNAPAPSPPSAPSVHLPKAPEAPGTFKSFDARISITSPKTLTHAESGESKSRVYAVAITQLCDLFHFYESTRRLAISIFTQICTQTSSVSGGFFGNACIASVAVAAKILEISPVSAWYVCKRVEKIGYRKTNLKMAEAIEVRIIKAISQKMVVTT